MLAVIWIVLLDLGAIALSYHVFVERPQQESDKSEDAMFAACAASAFAVALAWDFTARPVFVWLGASLPQHGEEIHEFTVLILGFAACFVLWMLPMVTGAAVAELQQRLKARGVPAARES